MIGKRRMYFVIDMKSFFASVECAERGLDPMTTKLVVADERRTNATICLAVSPALKKMSVKNRCRLFEIPESYDFIIAKPRMKKYIEYAANIYSIYLKYIDKMDIHTYSIDESILDVTDYLKLYKIKALDFALMLKNEIKEKCNIPATIGIGTNMYLAKIALDITAKHSSNGIGFLTESKFKDTLWNYRPLTDFWQISTGTVARLAKYNIFDMEGIAKADEDLLYNEFGVNAELLIDHSKGIETCLMEDIKNYKSKGKSISSSQILPCNYCFADAKLILLEMLQNGCYDLFKQNYVTNSLFLFVGYGDVRHTGDKSTVKLPITTNLYSQMLPYVNNCIDNFVDKSKPIRKVGYAFLNIKPTEFEHYDLLTDMKKVEKEKRAIKTILLLHNEYGKNSVLKAVNLQKKSLQIERNKMIGGHSGGED